MYMVIAAAAGAAGAVAWLVTPFASMAVKGTIDQRQRAACRT